MHGSPNRNRHEIFGLVLSRNSGWCYFCLSFERPSPKSEVDFNTPPARSYERLRSEARLLSPHPYYPPDPDLHGSHVCLRCRIIYPHGALFAEHLHTTTHILRRGKSGDCNADAEPPRSSGRKMDFYARLAMPLSPFSGHRTKLKHSGSHSYTTIY